MFRTRTQKIKNKPKGKKNEKEIEWEKELETLQTDRQTDIRFHKENISFQMHSYKAYLIICLCLVKF